jgi:hypothetical protein
MRSKYEKNRIPSIKLGINPVFFFHNKLNEAYA